MKPVQRPTVLTALVADEWATRCDREAAYWLRNGVHPDLLNPASGVPLALDRRDPRLEPCVAEAELRMDEAEMLREHRRERWQKIGVVVVLAAILAAVALVIGAAS